MKSDVSTKSTSIIKQVNWPVDEKFMAFSVPTCAVDKNTIEKKIEETYAEKQSMWSMFPFAKGLHLVRTSSI